MNKRFNGILIIVSKTTHKNDKNSVILSQKRAIPIKSNLTLTDKITI